MTSTSFVMANKFFLDERLLIAKYFFTKSKFTITIELISNKQKHPKIKFETLETRTRSCAPLYDITYKNKPTNVDDMTQTLCFVA